MGAGADPPDDGGAARMQPGARDGDLAPYSPSFMSRVCSPLASYLRCLKAFDAGQLHLTPLAPGIVEAILNGWRPDGMTLLALMEPFPVEWGRQQAAIPIAPLSPLTAKC